MNKWTSYKCWHFQLVMSIDLVKLYTDDRVVKSSKNSPSTLWCHMSAELVTCSWFFNKILQNQLPTHRAAYFKTLWPPCWEHCLQLDVSLDRFTQWFDVTVFLLPVIVLVLFSAGAFKTTLYANTTSRIFFSYVSNFIGPQLKKKHIQLWIIFAS